MSVTLKDIAKRVGKSITTVSRALNGYEDVSLSTREFVQQVAEEMGYHPNSFAQRLQKQRTDQIGVILPILGVRSTDMFLSEFLSGIGNRAREVGYDLLVAFHHPGDEEMDSYHHMVKGHLVDGFILTRTRQEDSRIQYLMDEGVPFVSFGRTSVECGFPYIDIDGEEAIRQVTNYLVSLGHQKIACIASPNEYHFTLSRLNGFKTTMEEHNLSIPKNYICYGDLQQESGYQLGGQLLNLIDPPTAIIGFNDMMAYGCLLAAQERDICVPDDLSITGFDDIAFSVLSNPPLTTVSQPVYDIGEELSSMLTDIIQGKELNIKQKVIKPELIVRCSCASPK